VFTRLIDERGEGLLPALGTQRERAAALAAASLLEHGEPKKASSPWDAQDGWTLQGIGATHVRLQELDGTAFTLKAKRVNGSWDVTSLDGRHIETQGHAYTAHVDADRIAIYLDGEWHRFGLVSQPSAAGLSAGKDALQAPMPGVVLAVRATDGDQVQRGQILIVLEAMKMEHALSAGGDGMVSELRVKAGDRVREGDLLLKITAASEG
jgi:acetyl/propionyl-CoA carboxylase alpha subunit